MRELGDKIKQGEMWRELFLPTSYVNTPYQWFLGLPPSPIVAAIDAIHNSRKRSPVEWEVPGP